MHNHKIPFGHYRSRFVLEFRRHGLNEIEKAFATRFDMSAVLNVVGRPIALGRRIVPLVEQCVEGLKDKLFVLFLNRLIHFYPPSPTSVPPTSELSRRFAAVDEVGSSRDERG